MHLLKTNTKLGATQALRTFYVIFKVKLREAISIWSTKDDINSILHLENQLNSVRNR